jgi:hypothetical protein
LSRLHACLVRCRAGGSARAGVVLLASIADRFSDPQETTISTERRQFARVAFASGAELITTQANLPCQVIDISLKGVLLQLPAGKPPAPGMPCLVKLPLSNTEVAMAGELAHVEGDHAGVLCRSIDLESMTHLRRLIEMNLGDPRESERELKALIAGV